MSRWIRRFGGYARGEAPGLAALFGLMLVGVAIEALLPWPLKIIADHVLTAQPLPSAAAWIAHLPGAASGGGMLGCLAFALVLLFLCGQVVQLLKSSIQANVSGRMQYRLAGDVFDHLQSLALTYHGKANKGDLVCRIAMDSSCMPTLIGASLLPLVTALLTLIVLFAVMWQLDPMLACIALGVAVPLGILLRLLGPRMTERAYQQQQQEGAVWTVAEQTLTSLPVVQAFGREEYQGHRFKDVSARTIHASMRAVASQLQFKIGVDGSLAIGTAAVMVIGGLHVLRGETSVGTLIVFLSYVTALYAPLVTLAYLSSTFATAAGSARRVMDVLDAREAVPEAPDARPLARHQRGPGGQVRLEGIVFGYAPGAPVLRGVDVEALPGETIALVGPTGVGKTTLVSLIPRLFDPWEGRVLIDGQDVRAATLASVREQVGLLLQDPFLLPLSIADNIAYGRQGAHRDAVVAAAVAAHADEFIRRLPRGYDEIIGERGVTLSGGERQRIAIARALLKDAPILILDEPTAALDAQTEALVMAAIKRLTRERTTFVIAHRLSTVRGADRIVVLDAGRVVEIGAHEALLARSGAYRRLYAAMQLAPVARAAGDAA